MARAARSGPSPTADDRPTRDVDRWEYERGLRGAPLGLATRGVLAALVSRMDSDGTTRSKPQVGAVASLAADLRVKERVVSDHLRAAHRAGYLRRDGKSYVGHVAPWVLCLPRQEATSHASPSTPAEVTSQTFPPRGEVTSQTSERGRATRQRGDAPDVPHQTFQTDQTSSSPREEPAVYVESAARPDDETTTPSAEEHTIGDELRSLVEAAGKSSASWTDRVVERLRDRVWEKAGTMALDWQPVARAIARRGVESPLPYLASWSADEVRDAAEPPAPRQRTTPAPRPPSPYRCKHGHPNGLRRSPDGASLCAACDGAAPVLSVAAS